MALLSKDELLLGAAIIASMTAVSLFSGYLFGWHRGYDQAVTESVDPTAPIDHIEDSSGRTCTYKYTPNSLTVDCTATGGDAS